MGVSSFGFGGTGAHVIIGAPPETGPESPTPVAWFGVSADSEDALIETAKRWADALEAAPEQLHDMAYTSLCGRSHRKLRAVIPVTTSQQVCDDLRALRDEHRNAPWPKPPESGRRTHGPPTAWSGERYWSVTPMTPADHRHKVEPPPAKPGDVEVVARDAPLRQHLKQMIGAVMGIDNIAVEDNLLNLGLDSVMALEVRNQLQELLKRRLSPTLLMEYPSISALCSHLGEGTALTGLPHDEASTADQLTDELIRT